MGFGGRGWRPSNRRARRQAGRPSPSTEKGADRAFIIILVVFGLVALGLVIALGVTGT